MKKNASEKQVEFMRKLWGEKGVEIMPWVGLLDRLNVGQADFELGEIESWKASKIIGFLLTCKPKKYYEVIAESKKNNMDKYEKLIAWAKNQGIKGVRARMKKINVLNKIQEAGLVVPAELV